MQHEVVAMVGEGEHQQRLQGGGKGDGIAHKGEATERKAHSDGRHKQHGRSPFLHEIEPEWPRERAIYSMESVKMRKNMATKQPRIMPIIGRKA